MSWCAMAVDEVGTGTTGATNGAIGSGVTAFQTKVVTVTTGRSCSNMRAPAIMVRFCEPRTPTSDVPRYEGGSYGDVPWYMAVGPAVWFVGTWRQGCARRVMNYPRRCCRQPHIAPPRRASERVTLATGAASIISCARSTPPCYGAPVQRRHRLRDVQIVARCAAIPLLVLLSHKNPT